MAFLLKRRKRSNESTEPTAAPIPRSPSSPLLPLPSSLHLPSYSQGTPPAYAESEPADVTVHFTFDPYNTRRPLGSFANGPFHPFLRRPAPPHACYPVSFNSPTTLALLHTYHETIHGSYPALPSAWTDMTFDEVARAVNSFRAEMDDGPPAAFAMTAGARFLEVAALSDDEIWSGQELWLVLTNYTETREAREHQTIAEWTEALTLAWLLQEQEECWEQWEPLLDWNRESTASLRALVSTISSTAERLHIAQDWGVMTPRSFVDRPNFSTFRSPPAPSTPSKAPEITRLNPRRQKRPSTFLNRFSRLRKGWKGSRDGQGEVQTEISCP